MKKIELHETYKVNNLKDILTYSCEKFKDNYAFLEKDKKTKKFYGIRFSEFKQDVIALGTMLNRELGLQDKVIAVVGENSYKWMVSYMATVCGNNNIIVPLDKELPINEIESCLERSKASAIIYSAKKKDVIEEIMQKENNISYYISMEDLLERGKNISLPKLIQRGKTRVELGDNSFMEGHIDRDKLSILLFTSGTTSKSKAVMLSHKNIATNIESLSTCVKVYGDGSDIALSILPMHHTYESTSDITLLYHGATIAICSGLKYIASEIKEVMPTALIAVPLLLENLHSKLWSNIHKKKKEKLVKLLMRTTDLIGKKDLKRKVFKEIHNALGGRLRIIVSGAAPLNPEVCKDFTSFGITCIQGYGLTETAPMVTIGHDEFNKPGSVGFESPNIKVRIDNPDENGMGEIIVQGDNVMLGYYEDEESTKEVIIDGWFHTGDIGYFDKDGFLYINGRKKNVIVTKNGKKIFPEEIEYMLNEYGMIKESMVYGFEDLDDDITVSADIVLDKDYVSENKIEENKLQEILKGIIKEINSKLVGYKSIKKFDIRENEFVKTTTMKIKRYIEQNKNKDKNEDKETKKENNNKE